MEVTISQEYFDEVCLENRDDFELSEEDALQDTIQQLASSSSVAGQAGGAQEHPATKLPSHLTLTFPTSPEGLRQRAINQTIQSCVARIKSFDDNNDGNNSRSGAPLLLSETLQTLLTTLQEDPTQRVPRFVVYGGFDAGMELWRTHSQVCDEQLYQVLLLTLEQCAPARETTTANLPTLLEDLQRTFLRLWPTWLATWEEETSSANVNEWKLERMNQILQLAILGVKHSEPNKKAFMAAKSTTSLTASPSLLLGALDKLSATPLQDGDATNPNGSSGCHERVGGPLCRLVAALCTFDDFRAPGGAAPTVSSAHANVQSFHQVNGVVRIARYMQEQKETSAAILALRAMAIHDEIVQAMVAVGVLDTSTTLFQRLLSSENHDNDSKASAAAASTLEALTAIVGLFRNVCANDEIKSKLCIGDKSIVPCLVASMEAHPDAAKLQEHACATMGAMALRSPRNAEFLVKQNDAATWIVRAMQRHPSRTTVQRQGALSLRNLVSRSTDLRPVVIQAGAAEALKDIAAKHVSCQDEVYAALRDLGLPASLLRVEHDASGQLVMKQTEMFGERKSNFRPVFD